MNIIFKESLALKTIVNLTTIIVIQQNSFLAYKKIYILEKFNSHIFYSF